MATENAKDTFVNQVKSALEARLFGKPHEVRLDGSYKDVVYRLGSALPLDVVFDWYSSSPSETGGKITFPYDRVDSDLIVIPMQLHLTDVIQDQTKKKGWYEEASRTCAKMLSWVDIGWEGLRNLGSHPASRNWTSGPGHHASDEERAEYIATEGETWVNKVVGEYSKARRTYDPQFGQNDVFRKHKIEHLLERRTRTEGQ